MKTNSMALVAVYRWKDEPSLGRAALVGAARQPAMPVVDGLAEQVIALDGPERGRALGGGLAVAQREDRALALLQNELRRRGGALVRQRHR